MVRDGRLELPTSCSQSKRATNCANPGFLVIEFCSKCGQTCGQAVFLTILACGGSACIAGVSRDCGHSIFQLEGGATRSQSRRATNCATPRYEVRRSGWAYSPKKNQARYQLRYTRMLTGGASAPPVYCTLLSARTQGGSETFFHPGLPPAGKTAPQASSASRRQTLTPAMARAKTNQKMLITRG